MFAMTSLRHGLSASPTTLIRELCIQRRTDHLPGNLFPHLMSLHCFKIDIVILQPAAVGVVTDVILQEDQSIHMHHPSTVVRVASTLKALTCPLHNGLLACLKAPEQPLLRLRMLCVHEHHDRIQALAIRMLDSILDTASGSACPELEILLFEVIFVNNPAGTGHAFSHFARCVALMELCITNRHSSRVTPMLHAAVVDAWAAVSSTGAGNSRRSNSDEDTDDDNQVAEASCCIQAPPSLALHKVLSICIEPESMALLARMFPALTRLAVAAEDGGTGVERPVRPDFWAAMGALPVLHSLDVRPGYDMLLIAADVGMVSVRSGPGFGL
jgi:hypothetical protein